MLRTVCCVALMATSGSLHAQTFQSFKDQCIADQRAACAAGKWWRASPVQQYQATPPSIDGAGYSPIQTKDFVAFAGYVCGSATYNGPAAELVSSYSGFAAANPAAASALVSAASRIEGDCAAQARQLVLLQAQLDVQKENQLLLKGDIQAILGKLMPGATVNITLPPAKPASAPK